MRVAADGIVIAPAVPSTDVSTMHRAAELLVRYPFQRWFYGDSVAFEGLLAASNATGDPRFRAFAYGFIRSWAARPQPFRELDNSAPGYALCQLYRETGDELLLEAALQLSSFLRARRRIAGVFVSFERPPLHPPYGGGTVTAADADLMADPGPGVFVDPVHFDPPFFASLGQISGDSSLLQLAAEQALGYVRLLQAPDTGLFSHFWLETTGETYGGGWSRGSGWALLGLVDLLPLAPSSGPERHALVLALEALVDGLVRTQREDGHWHAVADDPGSGDESSTAAFVAAGLFKALADGTLRRPELEAVAERALRATLAAINDNGLLTGVSRCVWPCTVPSHYRHVPRGHPEPWGQGPLLLALARDPARRAGVMGSPAT